MSTGRPDPPAPPPLAPARREEPLPTTVPKSPEDDPGALGRIYTLLSSAAYVRADRDPALLQRDELRPVRLLLDYLKPELALEDHDIVSTIVLFGGTRIVEPAAAERALRDAQAAADAAPDDARLARRLTVAERLHDKSRYYEVARAFARLVSAECQRAGRCEFVIMTGGGPGIMEAGNRGAFETDRKTIGLNITLPMEQYPNPYITPDLCLQFRYFALRKLHFLKRARALVAFPGGYGTMDELFEALCLLQTRTIEPMPIVLVGRDFWRHAVDFDFLVAEGVIAPEDAQLFTVCETAEEIWGAIRRWHDEHGAPV